MAFYRYLIDRISPLFGEENYYRGVIEDLPRFPTVLYAKARYEPPALAEREIFVRGAIL